MPVKPLFDWEEDPTDIHVRILIKGFKKDGIDVYLSDVFVKVNAAPTYVLALDLLHPIDTTQSSVAYLDRSAFRAEMSAPFIGKDANQTAELLRALEKEEGTLVRCRLHKCEPKLWGDMCVDVASFTATASELGGNTPSASNDQKTTEESSEAATIAPVLQGMEAIRVRRDEAMKRAARQYVEKLESRKKHHEDGKRRAMETQWEQDKELREVIEQRIAAERVREQKALYAWEDDIDMSNEQQQAADAYRPSTTVPMSPGDVGRSITELYANAHKENALQQQEQQQQKQRQTEVPPLRQQGETVTVTIDFTPKSMTIPTRSRGDEEYYRKSRYRPVKVEDSPMFWKEKGDSLYRTRDFLGAANAYTESIKRDGAFLTCVSNRAACWLQLNEFKRAIEDTTLALSMLSDMPASEISQDRYKAMMMKLHSRRGAAFLWSEKYVLAVEDLRVAAAYSDPSEDTQVREDLALAEGYLKDLGIVEETNPESAAMHAASSMYFSGAYNEAAEAYVAILSTNPSNLKAHSNLCLCYLQVGKFQLALDESLKVVELCGDVAVALLDGEEGQGEDSDDEDEELQDAEVEGGPSDIIGENGIINKNSNNNNNAAPLLKERAVPKKGVGERSSHVYQLLKAYVRASAALCGLNDYRQAHYMLEQAVRITPYDDDLREDCNRIAEKLRLQTLIGAATGGAK